MSVLPCRPVALTARLHLPQPVRPCAWSFPDLWRLERGGASILYDPERVALAEVRVDRTRDHKPGDPLLVLPITVLHVVARSGTSRTWEWDGRGLFLAYTVRLPKDPA